MSFHGPHLLGIRDLSKTDIGEILDAAESFRAVLDRDIKRCRRSAGRRS